MQSTLSTTQIEQEGRSGTVFVFLSLFLLVLAFFIVLVTISTVETAKSHAVLKSVTDTFTPFEPTDDERTDFTAKEGDVLAGQSFQEQITGIFATAIQVAKVEIVKPGRLMRAEMPAGALFAAQQAAVRESAHPFMDRVIAALGGRPPGLRFDLEFALGTPVAADRFLPLGQTLEMERIGAFAREMTARGAPPDSLAVGLVPGDPGRVTMRFYVRHADDAEHELQRRQPGPG